ncbi:hypothetical protein FHS29_006922 [Saccharothrix tamanrassetensis]|uniref:Uncharacterized protein n=1 Tax=Saccharothrix tamanrassetensis TaxID=1051531 RepID=A0A841CSL9_9PSEU|nr:hypothetical protein [Saccharothrix tamanrassetensis]MBB5960299.1 hypothetical protein [Saccharothrix tamanrassetensis]
MASTLVHIVDAAPIDRVADELYALPPARFTAARDAHARAALDRGDKALAKEVSALRKPTQAAWALNQLARYHAAELAEAVALGEQLRAAQEELRGSVLRELGTRRRVVVAALVRLTEELAADCGTPLGPDAVQQVRSTLTSALADAVLAARIRAGRLVRPVEQSGFGPLSETATPVRVRDDLAPRREQRRERKLAQARDDITAARAEVKAADTAVTEAEATLVEREDHSATLRAELRRAQQAEQEAATRVERAKRRADTARTKLAGAESRMTELRGDSV